jgi:hypothetical protein
MLRIEHSSSEESFERECTVIASPIRARVAPSAKGFHLARASTIFTGGLGCITACRMCYLGDIYIVLFVQAFDSVAMGCISKIRGRKQRNIN